MQRAAIVIVLLGCSSAPKPIPLVEVRPEEVDQTRLLEDMHWNFNRLSTARDAVVDGTLEVARVNAKSMLEVDFSNAPTGWSQDLSVYESSARRLSEAETLAAAAASVGEVAGTCGSCHRRLGVSLSFDIAEPRMPWDEAEGTMAGHELAVAAMWQGLVGPSDSLWIEGANALAETPLSASGDHSAKVAEAAEGVHEMGVQAMTLEPSERPELFGTLLGTCSGCHAELQSQGE